MKAIVVEGLRKAKEEYVRREDEHAGHDLEIEADFWLTVENCDLCDSQLCTTHYDRLVMCL